MSIFNWLFKKKKISASEFLSQDLSDEEYLRIYDGDLEAIAEAKASWYSSGEEVIRRSPYAFSGDKSE